MGADTLQNNGPPAHYRHPHPLTPRSSLATLPLVPHTLHPRRSVNVVRRTGDDVGGGQRGRRVRCGFGVGCLAQSVTRGQSVFKRARSAAGGEYGEGSWFGWRGSWRCGTRGSTSTIEDPPFGGRLLASAHLYPVVLSTCDRTDPFRPQPCQHRPPRILNIHRNA